MTGGSEPILIIVIIIFIQDHRHHHHRHYHHRHHHHHHHHHIIILSVLPPTESVVHQNDGNARCEFLNQPQKNKKKVARWTIFNKKQNKRQNLMFWFSTPIIDSLSQWASAKWYSSTKRYISWQGRMGHLVRSDIKINQLVSIMRLWPLTIYTTSVSNNSSLTILCLVKGVDNPVVNTRL